MTTINLAVLCVSICILIAVLWWAGLKIHVLNMEKFYKRRVMNMEAFTVDSDPEKTSRKDRLLRLCFYRQVTYEFAAYALVVLCIGFLAGCIYFFVKAGNYVPLKINEQPLNVSQYLISVVSIRAGVALVIFFICQVLLKLYRFCLRLTNFYTSLFDALFVVDELPTNLKTALEVFSFPSDLEPTPESPSDKVIEILKNVK